ncbi:NAD(P)/FAD-dependent oxidoreductase [Paenibacillus sp. YYML68]|uniref:phytoene desaturase family protein n=1 Tax=Paenibacillus sp. YYML68 TaxID=2909250 RepID=UPI002493672C|nr:phytoene desaturase family protein [Paenibacillus sp. YYML68]
MAIVGGGVGGLTAALLLTNRGYKVDLFEKQSRLGGRLAYEEEGPFRIDQGPTIVLLPDMIRDVLGEAGVDVSRLELLPCDPLYRIHYPDGTLFEKRRDPLENAYEVERVFPGEGKSFLMYMEAMKHRFEQGKARFLERDFVRKSDFWKPGNVSALLRLKAYRSVYGDTSAFFRSPRLREAYSFQTLYIGGSPLATPALYSLIPYSEHAHGIWYVKGGYAGLVQLLEEELLARGAVIRTGTAVERIVTDNGTCKGLVVGGERLAYEHVVLNGDFPLNQSLLDSHVAVDRGHSRSYKPSSGCLLLYLGLNRTYRSASVHQFFFADSYQELAQDVFSRQQLPRDPYMYVFHPSLVDTSLAPEGHSVMYVLVPVPSGESIDWAEAKAAFVDKVLQRLESRGFPDLRSSIVWQRVRTPEDAAVDGLYGGGSFGIAPTLGQSGVFRPQVAPYGVKGLYAVGASVHPGGGVPIVMQGAKLLADYIERASGASA